MRFLALFFVLAVSLAAETPLSFALQSRSAAGKPVVVKEQWLPSRTAIIVCDMWDLHHCKNAVTRETEMAPRMNEVLEKARAAGVLIIHAPSSCMKPYEGTPARERAKTAPAAPRLPDKIGEWCKQIPAEEMAVYPLDQSDGGEDDDPAEHAAWAKELEAKGLNPKAPWTKQIDLLRIDQAKDVISDSGVEIWNLLESKNIDNVILMGVHLNMCVSGRPFGLRQMAKNGKHVVLMRDLTDTMYNPARWPFVSHTRGTELFTQHVERLICPTITSDQLIGGQPFTFSDATAAKTRLQIILLGDSTTEASFPKRYAADEPQFEDMLRVKLATEGDLPPCDVYNVGVSGEFIRRLLDTRYDKAVKTKPQADYIFIRYGLNDAAKVTDFKTAFPKDFHELLERPRKDHPKAMLIPMTAIPYALDNLHEDINALIKQIAAEEKLTLFDIAPRYLAEARQITLELHLDPATCHGDTMRLGQVVTNLLSNAIEHTRDRITITTQRQNGHALLTIADNGPGIPEEHLPHLFDRFYRAEASRTRGTDHNGLGLAISKAIVDAHGGDLSLENDPQGGARARLQLAA